MRKFLFTLTIGLVVLQSAAQDFSKNYTPLRNAGNIPESFLSKQPFIDEPEISAQADANNQHISSKSSKRFSSLTNIALKFLLQSGDLMFGDPITNYVNRVADILLKDFPEIRNQLQIYVSRYSEVNAVCLPNGIIIVNIGLIAQLENEAELAFTLAHEIVHFVKKHSINAFIENSDFWNNGKNARKNIDQQFAMLQYQKDQEFEADHLGYLDYFLNSGYKTTEAEAMCDVLLYGDLPVDEIEFRLDSVEDEWFKLPDRCITSYIDPVSAIEDYRDEYMSHPNIKKRRDRLQCMIDSTSVSGTYFIQPKGSFLTIRNKARFELCLLYLNEKKYVDAYYLVYILQQDYPNNVFLNRIKAEALYRMNLLVRDRETMSGIRSPEKQKGESQRLFYMLRGFTGDELCVYTCRELWKVHRQLPSDKTVMFLTTDCFRYLFKHTKYPLARFILEDPQTDSTTSETDTAASESKYDKIRKSQGQHDAPDAFEWAFYRFRNDTSFGGFLKRANSSNNEDSIIVKRVTFKKAGGVVKSDFLPPITNLIVYHPFYIKSSVGSIGKGRLINSLEHQEKISILINKASSEAGISAKVMDPAVMQAGDVDDYNNYQQLSEWVNYMPDEDDGEGFRGFNQDQIDSICDYYNTRFIAFTGIISNRIMHTNMIGPKVLAGVILYPIYPVIMYATFAPMYKTYYFFDIYDLKTGRKVYAEMRRIHSRDYSISLENMYLNTFLNLKHN